MSDSEKLCLQWNEFQKIVSSSFADLKEDRDFTDVTLVSGDGEQLEAHKVVLASSSSFFHEILERSKHPSPLIYMRGINMVDLTALVDFIYFGETSVQHGNIDPFLALAKELGLKGMESSAKEEVKPAFDSFNGGDCFDDDLSLKPSRKDSPLQIPLQRKGESSDDEEERNQTLNKIESTEGKLNVVEEAPNMEESCDSAEKETNQPIGSNCHQPLAVRDAVKLIQRKNWGSVSRIPPKPESGTIWRFQTDRC